MTVLPKWIEEAPQEDRSNSLVRFKLLYAALMYSPSGSMKTLSLAIGQRETTLYNGAANWSEIPPTICVAIEKLLGREVCTREFLNPTIFSIED